MLGKCLQIKTTALLVLFVSKVFEKLVNNRYVDNFEKRGLFLISSMVLDLMDQLQIFWQLHLIKLLWPLTGLGYSNCSTWYIQGFWQGVACWSSSNVSLMEFQFKYLALFLLVSVIDGFEWFWMGSFIKNIQIMVWFFKAPFLVLRFYYYPFL